MDTAGIAKAADLEDRTAPPQTVQSESPLSMIIRTGTASVQVDSLEPAIARVKLLAQQMGGYIANSSMQAGREQLRAASLEIKLPAQRWDQLLGGLTPIGKVESVNTETEDVTDEYVDVNARVANAHRLEERLVALLATRTGKLKDVLDVERELARVREEIERYEGRMRYLRLRSAISTLTVTVHERPPIVGTNPSHGVIATAFVDAWRNFVSLTAGFISMLGVLIPLGVLAGVAIWLYRRFAPRRPRRLDPPKDDDTQRLAA